MLCLLSLNGKVSIDIQWIPVTLVRVLCSSVKRNRTLDPEFFPGYLNQDGASLRTTAPRSFFSLPL